MRHVLVTQSRCGALHRADLEQDIELLDVAGFPSAWPAPRSWIATYETFRYLSKILLYMAAIPFTRYGHSGIDAALGNCVPDPLWAEKIKRGLLHSRNAAEFNIIISR
jgi:hypothetical protein